MTGAGERGANPAKELADIALMRFLGPEVRQLVTAAFTAHTFAFGDVIVREGEPSDAIFVIIAGRARVIRLDEGGREVGLRTLGPGESFGELGLLHGGTRTATIRASSEVRLLRLDRAIFDALVATNPELERALASSARQIAVSDFLQLRKPFGELSPSALSALVNNVEPMTVAAAEIVVGEGEEADCFYIVQDGRLRAYAHRNAPSGDLAYYRSGDVFGERALYLRERRWATIQAISDVQLLRCEREVFDQLMLNEEFRTAIESKVSAYDYQQLALVPLDFSEEVLPPDSRGTSDVPDVSGSGSEYG